MLAAAPEASTDLTAAETDRLVELEQAVDRGLQTFVEVGQALAEIRERSTGRAMTRSSGTAASGRVTRQRALQFRLGPCFVVEHLRDALRQGLCLDG